MRSLILGAGPAGLCGRARSYSPRRERTDRGPAAHRQHRGRFTAHPGSVASRWSRTTARCCAAPTPRVAYWAGKRITGSRESLVSRARFEAALGRDLVTAGIHVLRETVRDVRSITAGFSIETDVGERHAHVVIDARGRRARRADALGPRLVALSELHRPLRAVQRGSALVAMEHGWCWIASTGGDDDQLLLQYVGSPHGSEHPSSAGLLAVESHYCACAASGVAVQHLLYGYTATANTASGPRNSATSAEEGHISRLYYASLAVNAATA
jgi:hypothetical protein